MVRNRIAKEHFISIFVLPVSYSHERLGKAMSKYGIYLMSNAKYGDMLHLNDSKQ